MSDLPYIREYPSGWRGRRTYVMAVGHGIVAKCYTYTGYDGRSYVQGDDAGKGYKSTLPSPYVMSDIGEYQSPIDNSFITSRSAHRDHLKLHDVLEVGNSPYLPPPDTPVSKGIGEVIKRHIEEVKVLPQNTYNEHVNTQQAEHAAVANLIVVS